MDEIIDYESKREKRLKRERIAYQAKHKKPWYLGEVTPNNREGRDKIHRPSGT